MLNNAEIKVKVFTDSHPLLETLGSTSQVAEKGLSIFEGASEVRKCRELWMDTRKIYYSRYINKDRIKKDRVGLK